MAWEAAKEVAAMAGAAMVLVDRDLVAVVRQAAVMVVAVMAAAKVVVVVRVAVAMVVAGAAAMAEGATVEWAVVLAEAGKARVVVVAMALEMVLTETAAQSAAVVRVEVATAAAGEAALVKGCSCWTRQQGAGAAGRRLSAFATDRTHARCTHPPDRPRPRNRA